jgi:flagellar biosynthesis/type III secretory pathway chaperone
VSTHPAQAVLNALETLLAEEREALVRLDRDAIDAFATQKLELDQRLRDSVRNAPLGDAQRAHLVRIREQALSNQLLLAHARSCVQGVLSLLSPQAAPAYGNGTQPGAVPPVALNLRS